MNLRSVQLFRMIVRTGSLAAAAARMGMSASAASRMVALLEHELGLTLFSRRNRNLDLTDEGREFLRRTQHILEGLERLTDIAAQVRSVEAAPLRLVATVPLAISLFGPMLALWQREHPQTRSVLNIETRFDLESKVAAREYNLGILSLPVENAIVDLDVQPLVAARHEIAMSPDHPLAAGPTVPVAALAEQAVVALRPAQLWRQRLDALCATYGVSPRIVCETGSTAVALDLVRRGMGVTLADRVIAGLERDPRLVLRPLEPEIWTEYCLITGAGRASGLTRAFAQRMTVWLQACRADDAALAASLRLPEAGAVSRAARALPSEAS